MKLEAFTDKGVFSFKPDSILDQFYFTVQSELPITAGKIVDS
jgi:hypothetical protein